MLIALDIPDQLAAQAKAQGVPVEEYIQQLIARHTAPAATQSGHSPEQIDAFFKSMAEGSKNLPVLPTDSLTRESFYKP